MITDVTQLQFKFLHSHSAAYFLIERVAAARNLTPLLEGKIKVTKVLKVEKKDGYEIRTEMWDSSGIGEEDTKMVTCYTPTGDWIGDVKTAKYLVDEKGIDPELIDKNHSVCSVGFCDKDQKWAGWSHRALCMFGIGDKVFEEDFGNDQTLFVQHGKVTIDNLDQAREAAVNFANYIS